MMNLRLKVTCLATVLAVSLGGAQAASAHRSAADTRCPAAVKRLYEAKQKLAELLDSGAKGTEVKKARNKVRKAKRTVKAAC